MSTVDTTNATAAAQSVKAGKPDPEPAAASVRRSAGIGQLAAALAKAQAEMSNPTKDSVNPHFKSKYADLATVRDAVLPTLAKHGLSVMQLPCELGAAPALVTVLAHSSGEWVENTVLLRATKADPQGIGSALTYMRRYTLQAVAGVAAEDDDDGNAASRPNDAAPRQQRQRQDPRPQPPADNPQLREAVAAHLAKVTDRPGFVSDYRQYKAYIDGGQLGPGDVAALDPLFKATGEKYPKPAPDPAAR